MVHLDQLPNYLDQKLQNNDQDLQNTTNPPCVPSFALCIILGIVQLIILKIAC